MTEHLYSLLLIFRNVPRIIISSLSSPFLIRLVLFHSYYEGCIIIVMNFLSLCLYPSAPFILLRAIRSLLYLVIPTSLPHNYFITSSSSLHHYHIITPALPHKSFITSTSSFYHPLFLSKSLHLFPLIFISPNRESISHRHEQRQGAYMGYGKEGTGADYIVTIISSMISDFPKLVLFLEIRLTHISTLSAPVINSDLYLLLSLIPFSDKL